MNKKQENILKYVDFYLFREKYKNNYWIDTVKTAFKKVVHKESEFIGHKIPDAVKQC